MLLPPPRRSPLRPCPPRTPLLALAGGTALAWVACQGPEPFHPDQTLPGGGGSGGATAEGGSGSGGATPSGGMGPGGTATGGKEATGGSLGSTGGTPPATGGRGTGGVMATGGSATGGGAAGGASTGGAATGGRTGGAAGGAAAGGSAAGGSAAGGAGPNACATLKAIASLNVNTVPTNQSSLNIRVDNTGNDTIKLSDLRIRYYFKYAGTDDPTKLMFSCDYASSSADATINGSKIKIATGVTSPPPVTSTGADNYIEIGTTSTAVMNPLQNLVVNGRLFDSKYSGFSQAMDYSYIVSPSYKTDDHIAVYVGTCLAGGKPPQ